MAGVLLTEMSMDFTSEDPTPSPGYDSPLVNISGTERNEKCLFYRGMSGSVDRVAESISRNESNYCQNSRHIK